MLDEVLPLTLSFATLPIGEGYRGVSGRTSSNTLERGILPSVLDEVLPLTLSFATLPLSS